MQKDGHVGPQHQENLSRLLFPETGRAIDVGVVAPLRGRRRLGVIEILRITLGIRGFSNDG